MIDTMQTMNGPVSLKIQISLFLVTLIWLPLSILAITAAKINSPLKLI